MDGIMARWRRLGATLTESSQRIQELMAKLMQFEVRQTLQSSQMQYLGTSSHLIMLMCSIWLRT